MITNTKVTIIKRTVENRTSVYKPSKTYACHYEETRGVNTTNSGRALDEIENIVAYIPDIVDAKVEDLLIKGDVSESLGSYKEYRKKYKEAYIISAVDHYDFGSKHMRHTRIGAR